MTGIFATEDQLSTIERLRKERPLTEMYIQQFMQYHRVSHMMDFTRSLADDLVAIMEGRMKCPQKPEKKRSKKEDG